jgi:carbamoyltransferase
MYVIGISCFFHDSAVAVFKEGKLIFFSLEDRFSRLKHDSSFPVGAIRYVLENIILDKSEIERVFFYENTEKKFLRILRDVLSGYPGSYKKFLKVILPWVFEKFWIKSTISSHFNVPFSKIVLGDHHLSHSYYCFMSSGYKNALVICSDGMGDVSSLSIYNFERNKKVSQTLIREYPNTDSLGLIYSAFTGYFGFKVNDGECSLMALSRFGKPIHVDKILKIFNVKNDDEIFIHKDYFDFSTGADCLYTLKFEEEFGRPFLGNYSVSSLGGEETVSEEERYYIDLAASFHFVFEKVFCQIVETYLHKTNNQKLVVTGGVAQNCVLIKRLMKLVGIESVYVPPEPGDGGAAIGACLEYISDKYEVDTSSVDSTYMGRGPKTVDINRVLNIPSASYKGQKFTIESSQITNDEDLVNSIVDDLSSGKVIGLYRGPLEVGPRALGNRSILCLPNSKTAHEKLTRKIKKRAPFRPLALSLLEEDFFNYFEETRVSRLHKRMQTVSKVRSGAVGKIAFGLHIDNTTRPQVVDEECNDFYYKLLKRKKDKVGCSAVINTSFNPDSLPIIDSPVDAVQFLIKTELDTLVVENCIFRKRST